MKKVPAVEQVRISLKDGLTILDLKADNAVTLAQLRQIIKNNGFVPKDATITARGVPSSDGKAFTVGGTNELLSLTAPPKKIAETWQFTVGAADKR
jgi:hypothetical protein